MFVFGLHSVFLTDKMDEEQVVRRTVTAPSSNDLVSARPGENMLNMNVLEVKQMAFISPL